MGPLKMKLVGALVGLARATDGNEHLISEQSTSLLVRCLAAEPADEDELRILMDQVETVKRSMVPDCFHCANPCGKTAAYDLALLEQEPENLRSIKLRILKGLCGTPVPERLLYQGLIALGLEYPEAAQLQTLAEELEM